MTWSETRVAVLGHAHGRQLRRLGLPGDFERWRLSLERLRWRRGLLLRWRSLRGEGLKTDATKMRTSTNPDERCFQRSKKIPASPRRSAPPEGREGQFISAYDRRSEQHETGTQTVWANGFACSEAMETAEVCRCHGNCVCAVRGSEVVPAVDQNNMSTPSMLKV